LQPEAFDYFARVSAGRDGRFSTVSDFERGHRPGVTLSLLPKHFGGCCSVRDRLTAVQFLGWPAATSWAEPLSGADNYQGRFPLTFEWVSDKVLTLLEE